ncbi:restriction endonuclease [Thalassospira marina]|uniref:Restriction endonuclease n=1 Tax=Thalassospira marina TaxID=2048283 RepID=A0ABN5FKH5_9PROT|nr:restriction endonuclease [Thalassospira marina]AUG55276.1 restriction endonuclease [Thalassospira marina]
MEKFLFNDLSDADLNIDAVYKGNRNGNAGDDPLNRLLGVSVQGGFRVLGSRDNPRMIVLTTSMSDPEWPDDLDHETGVFTYFGDNKKPGREIHETPRYGNILLRNMFEALHSGERQLIPPIFVFSKAAEYRDMVFKGLVVPGVDGLSSMDDLVAVWKTTKNQRFQNYQAKFTVLDVPTITRKWINSLRANHNLEAEAPQAWIDWRKTGFSRPLKAVRSLEIRTKEEQLPAIEGISLINVILEKYSKDPYAFEKCAAEIVRLFLGESVVSIDLTRSVRDGGRDAVGKFLIGRKTSSVLVEFAMEAKCYSSKNSVGVKELSRLISRLRHRQFGILVTTSWVNSQAYKEIKEDGHPIVIISGSDIVRIFVEKGFSSAQTLLSWLQRLDQKSV